MDGRAGYDLAEWWGWELGGELGSPIVFGALGALVLAAGLVARHREDRGR